MTVNTAIRKSKMRNEEAFIFKCDRNLLNQARDIADRNRISVASFIRQSMVRNISLFESLDR